MTQTDQTPTFTLAADEKSAQVMVYTANALYWGDVVVKSMIRVSTWLRTNAAPDRVTIYNAKAMNTVVSTPQRPMQFPELHIATTQVLCIHMVPPAKDPPDYDPTEPNRRMVPVTLLIGNFRVDGHLRLAGKTTVAKFLEVTHEIFSPVYDAQISSLITPSFGTISVPYVLVRQELAAFAMSQAGL